MCHNSTNFRGKGLSFSVLDEPQYLPMKWDSGNLLKPSRPQMKSTHKRFWSFVLASLGSTGCVNFRSSAPRLAKVLSFPQERTGVVFVPQTHLWSSHLMDWLPTTLLIFVSTLTLLYWMNVIFLRVLRPKEL